MKDKPKMASVRPSPLASIITIVMLSLFLIFGIFFMTIPDDEGMGFGNMFVIIWILFCIGGIIYSIINLTTYSKSEKERIPVTSGDIIEIVEEKEAGKVDFEAKLRKLESLRKDNLISEEEYMIKRKEIMDEKW